MVVVGLLGPEFSSLQRDARTSPFFDMMVWAIILNIPTMALYFWSLVPQSGLPTTSIVALCLTTLRRHSISLALLAAGLCKGILAEFPTLLVRFL